MCVTQYSSALLRVLGDLEPGVQQLVQGNCTDIYVDITTNISLVIYDANRVSLIQKNQKLAVEYCRMRPHS
jgi:hypothetical protein